MKYKDLTYAEFEALTYRMIYEDYHEVIKENEMLRRRNLGLKSQVENLKRKEQRRYDTMVGGKYE